MQKKQPRFKQIKPWIARDGSRRYYINDWKDLIGLHVSYHKSGNVSGVYFDERGDKLGDISNYAYNKYVRSTKVWYDDRGGLHIDNLDPDFTAVAARIRKSVDAKYKH